MAAREASKTGRWAVPVLASVAFVVGSALRVWFALEVHPPAQFVQSDMLVYRMRAERLASWQLGPWETFTPVGYPAYLAAHFALGLGLDEVAISQALLGGVLCSLTVLVAARLARTRGEGPHAAVAAALAGLACVTYVPFIRYGALLLSEIPFAVGVTLAAWLLMRLAQRASVTRALTAGAVLALATAIRPNLLLIFPLLPCWLWIALGRDRRAAARFTLVVFAAALPLLGAVAVHNSRLRGRPTGLATNGGLNFFMARAQVAKVTCHEGQRIYHTIPLPNLIRYQGTYTSPVPFYDEEYFYREGLRLARNDPGTWWRSLGNLWEGTGLGRQSLWPLWSAHEGLLMLYRRLFAALALGPVIVGFVVAAASGRLLAREEAPRLLVYLLLLTVAVTLYVWLGDPRVRVPFDALTLALAAALWIDAGRAIQATRSARRAVVRRLATGGCPPASGSLGS